MAMAALPPRSPSADVPVSVWYVLERPRVVPLFFWKAWVMTPVLQGS